MNDGLAILAAWAQWVLIVGALATAVLRDVGRGHDDHRTLYRRRDDPKGPSAR